MTDQMLENRILELEKHSNHFQELLRKNAKDFDVKVSNREQVLEELKQIKDNISYIKNKAKVIAISRFKKAKSSLSEKELELEKANEAVFAVVKTRTWLEGQLDRNRGCP